MIRKQEEQSKRRDLRYSKLIKSYREEQSKKRDLKRWIPVIANTALNNSIKFVNRIATFQSKKVSSVSKKTAFWYKTSKEPSQCVERHSICHPKSLESKVITLNPTGGRSVS